MNDEQEDLHEKQFSLRPDTVVGVIEGLDVDGVLEGEKVSLKSISQNPVHRTFQYSIVEILCTDKMWLLPVLADSAPLFQ